MLHPPCQQAKINGLQKKHFLSYNAKYNGLLFTSTCKEIPLAQMFITENAT